MAGDPADRQTELLYFSLITLSTVSCGDIVPPSGTARIVTALEGVTGGSLHRDYSGPVGEQVQERLLGVTPTLWLGTSVTVKLTKVECGEKLQQVEVDRLKRLRTLMQNLVAAGKWHCPRCGASMI